VRLLDKCLNVSWFWNLSNARREIGAWRIDHNTERPHSALAIEHTEFAALCAAGQASAGLEEGISKGRSLPPDTAGEKTRFLGPLRTEIWAGHRLVQRTLTDKPVVSK
jgi:hypothetical protein